MSEKAPLLNYRLTTSTGPEVKNEAANRRAKGSGEQRGPRSTATSTSTAIKTTRTLGVFFGVVIPTLLSMFSVVVFLRIGFVVGQAGFYQSICMFFVAYIIITMTVLSVCAISTNGALDAGGAYYMISRALGPEFGGSIGIMFFFANVCGSALYVLGLVEAIMSAFGVPEENVAVIGGSYRVLPSGYWWSLLYGTVLLFICFIVCLVGAHIYTKAAFLIFLIVTTVLASVFSSFFIVGPRLITLPDTPVMNSSTHAIANYTGLRLHTLERNLWSNYTVDYTTGTMMSFATVFAVMFNGCTGIMAGSNMSGDLKNPSYSIPRGTLAAVLTTFITYNLLGLLAASSCERRLLQRDYSFLGAINIWPPLVTVGIYSSAVSAAMSNLIGASRILYALSKDNLFGGVLALMKKTSPNGNPWASVLVSWLLVQMVLFAGKLNTIAVIVTIFFLLVYAAVNLACLALEWASAPNFSNWGYISQALIFHQVRKYLLMLDVRKDHVKFWRPQVLLMVANPRSCVSLLSFINDLKKSGLYVLGHVKLGLLDELPSDPMQSRYDSWLSLVDHLNIKAFVNLTLADSVRSGVQNLLFITGFGGMRPNTLVLGFYDNCPPQDHLKGKMSLPTGRGLDTVCPNKDLGEQQPPFFPQVRNADGPKDLAEEEYVSVITDAVKMGKNVTLARYFSQFHRENVLSSTRKTVPHQGMAGPFVDVWPLNMLRPNSRSYVDICSLFLLQLACVLHESRAWSQARLRLFLCVEEGVSLQDEEEAKLRMMLKELRISAQVQMVAWDQVVALHWLRQRREGEEVEDEKGDWTETFPNNATQLTDEYIHAVNNLIRRHGAPQPAVRFLYLPHPPADRRRYRAYLHQVDLLSQDLGPTLLIHGVTPVVTTDI
ncbi:solute carrier family 12 member 9-like isoform X2 [Dunckerocampus dactyliophorus]|uniref:solute carrier family 12 member 9-like isoform X2 n=1 Tax=Dunckerocampus dactyliophorus TaxID=161453 RepID=UPI002406D697|nr:solute carrier family 12 member 9-like isoform X2 [Dunckerocampus dactyliophorus]